MTPLQVVCYSDGRPGHEKQTRAVISALGALTPVSTTVRTLEHTKGMRRLIQNVHHLFSSPSGDAPPHRRVDLIIGTGSTTHLPMVALKMRSRAKLVTCMSPEPWFKPWFDLCLIPRHDRPADNEIYFSTFGPPCLAPDGIRQDPHKGLVLAGGVDEKSHVWDTGHFISQVEQLTKSPDMKWTVASSGRTPGDTIARLRELADVNRDVTFYSADETPGGWIETAYATHDQVWVTADSVSMVYEALTAGCRVGVLPVKWKQSQNKFQDGIDDLKTHGMIGDFDQWIRGTQLPRPAEPLNEAQRCAEEMIGRWWPERLR